jgi:RsiW-degrading membrane proteinase PrsW (M82 family)
MTLRRAWLTGGASDESMTAIMEECVVSNPNPSVLLPRDCEQASISEMVPFRSKKINLLRSPILYLAGFTAIFAVVLFYLLNHIAFDRDAKAQVLAFLDFERIVLFYMMALALIGVHSYARTDKPITYYVLPGLFGWLFITSPQTHALWVAIHQIFDVVAGGDAAKNSTDWMTRLWWGATGPGLREELVKSAPILLGVAMTLWAAKFKWMPERLYNLLRVRSPLDGALTGFAVGCGFTYAETGGQYVEGAVIQYLKASHNLPGAFGFGIMLLIPRAMAFLAGHAAYSTIFGYFIGLAVIRPRLGWQLIGGGWLAAALLHGLWDARLPGGEYALAAVGLATGIFAVACLVKARQLEASLFGRSVETSGSIIVEGPRVAGDATTGFSSAPLLIPVTTEAAARLALTIEGARFDLRSGEFVDFGALPSLSGRGQGVRAEVIRHPTNPALLGLKNIGANAWYARSNDERIHAVEAQRSLRLSAGVSIDFGNGLLAQIVAA